MVIGIKPGKIAVKYEQEDINYRRREKLSTITEGSLIYKSEKLDNLEREVQR
jgi:hypothetical protein